MPKFIAAVVQMNSGIDLSSNVDAMCSGIEEAARQGANYIQTPEMTGLVQQNRIAFFDSAPFEDDDPVSQSAGQLAKQLGVTVHVGSTPIRLDEGTAANRAYMFGPDGNQIAQYDKIHMFDVDLDNGESWRESAVYRPGKHGVIAKANDAIFGMAICYDCRFPELHTTYARAGVEILTGPSCFTRQTGKAHWHTLLGSRAIENGAFMIAAAQGGDLEDGRQTFGHSIIINPWGEIIAEIANEDSGVALAEIDTDQVSAARSKVPNLINNRTFSVINAIEYSGQVA